MIQGIFHSGSGLGNQLFRYVATRVLALGKGYKFSMIAPGNFKGKDFMNIQLCDAHPCTSMSYHTEMPSGKVIPEVMPENDVLMDLWEEKTNYYNPEFNFIGDNTIIDGEFQDERYFGHRLLEIGEWLKVEPRDIPLDVCIINFRGGEFALYPDLFLTRDYWNTAISMMRKINPKMMFEVHTDDFALAKEHFPFFDVIQDIGINWRSLRYAKYAIISNSSFAILPRLLSHKDTYSFVEGFPATRYIRDVTTIAPRHWAGHNTKTWSRPDNFYKSFKYI